MTGATRLDKLVANLGYGSRREVHAMIRTGRIARAGIAVAAADARLTPVEALGLTIDDEPIDPLPGLVLALHKPLGVTCSHKEAGPLVYDLLPDRWRRRDPPLSAVGRLDKVTSGLLLVTDDGALLHRIIAPKARVPKRYRATLARPLPEHAGTTLASGTLRLEGDEAPLLPAALEIISPTDVRVTIVEGRYHQVRRMVAALGSHVDALHREAIGALDLPIDLAPGSFRELTAAEVDRVFAAPARL